jgi:hypothetical protein
MPCGRLYGKQWPPAACGTLLCCIEMTDGTGMSADRRGPATGEAARQRQAAQEKRLAEALRQNLRRRKAQAREREASEPESNAAPGRLDD